MSKTQKRPRPRKGYAIFELTTDDTEGQTQSLDELARKGARRTTAAALEMEVTLLKHHLNRHPVPDWVHQQVYLHPYPKELMLRNHERTQSTLEDRTGEGSVATLPTVF